MPKYRALLISVLCFAVFARPARAQSGDTNGLKPYVGYDTNGVVRVRGTYLNGVKTGLWTTYSPDGKKFNEAHVKDGKLDGLSSTWFPNGKRNESSFKAGKIDGWVRQWYANNQLELEVQVVQTKSEGKETTWYPNGQKKVEGNNRIGNRVGHWMEWDEKGAVIADGSYDDQGNPREGSVRVRDPKTQAYAQLKVFKNGVEIKP